MPDTFYNRLDFYRMLNAGLSNLAEIAVALGVSIRTLQRWKKSYDPEKGPYGSLEDISVRERAPFPHDLWNGFDGQGSVAVNNDFNRRGTRSEIISAVRQVALEGNIPAAKLLLQEYRDLSESGEDVLTVEKAVELLREWVGRTG
jgi:hypothetical protein